MLSGITFQGAVDICSGDCDAEEDRKEVHSERAIEEPPDGCVGSVVVRDEDTQGQGDEEARDTLDEDQRRNDWPRLEDQRHEEGSSNNCAQHNHQARARNANYMERGLEMVPIVVVTARNGMQHQSSDAESLDRENRSTTRQIKRAVQHR